MHLLKWNSKKSNKNHLLEEQEKTIILLLFFPVLTVILFYIIPFVLMVYYSFTDYNGFLPDYNFVGFNNYKKAINKNNLEFVSVALYYLFSGVLQFIIGTYLAVFVFFSKRKKLLITIIILPLFLNSVALGLLSILFFKHNGILNNFIYLFNSEYETIKWISNKNIVNYTLAIVSAWKYTPFTFLVMYTGISSINQNIIKSAKLFGANKYQITRYIIIPNVSLSIKICLLMLTVGAVTALEIPQIITKGAMGTKTILMYINEIAFNMRNYGYASVMTMIVLLIIFIVSIIFRRAGKDVD